MGKKPGYSSRVKNELIQQAIIHSTRKSNKNKLNRYTICEQLTLIMETRYVGDSLEYHSKRMNLDTTNKILLAIDDYIYNKQIA